MIVEELYDALIEAGASDEKTRAASRAMANMEGHFAGIRDDISDFRSDVDRRFSEVDRRISELRSYTERMFRLPSWMLGTILAFIVALFFKEFSR
jgi:hypothetical protein